MFENKTFENILSDMITYVKSVEPELDTRTGSLIYTALAPMALELESAYHEMDMILEETFLETASKEYLLKHAAQIGIEINKATNAHVKGEFNVDVAIGSRFNLDKFNYSVINKISDPTATNEFYTFDLMCETAGSEPNDYFGDITPISYIPNLSHARVVELLVYGEDEEDTEAFRSRIFDHIVSQPVVGNSAQYEQWLSEYQGIGKYRVSPCWNGMNTVKLLILDTENKSATPELISNVQDYFDPPTSTINDNRNASDYPQGRGMGNGQAPIGAIVTVDTTTEVPVKVVCKVVLKEGYSEPIGVKEGIMSYLDSLVLNKYTVSYMSLSAEIFNAESVEDVVSLTVTVKGTVMDMSATPFVNSVTLSDNEIPVLDTTNSKWSV